MLRLPTLWAKNIMLSNNMAHRPGLVGRTLLLMLKFPKPKHVTRSCSAASCSGMSEFRGEYPVFQLVAYEIVFCSF